jgi:hypothetical protein
MSLIRRALLLALLPPLALSMTATVLLLLAVRVLTVRTDQ